MKIKESNFEIEFCENQYELTIYSKKVPIKKYFSSFKSLLKYINKEYKINCITKYEKCINISKKNQEMIDCFTNSLINEYMEISR